MGRGMGWWVVGRGCKTWCACNIEKSKSNTSINTNISSCLYQCYCVSSHFTIRDYFIFPQKLKSVLNFLHFTCNFRGLRFRVFGLRFRYNRVSRPLGTNKRQKNSHLLTLNLSAGEKNSLEQAAFWHEVRTWCVLGLFEFDLCLLQNQPRPDHAPIVIVIQSEHLKHSISPRNQSGKHPDSGCFGISCFAIGSALSKGLGLWTKGFSRGSLFNTWPKPETAHEKPLAPRVCTDRPLVKKNRVNSMSSLFSRLQFKYSVHLSGFIA